MWLKCELLIFQMWSSDAMQVLQIAVMRLLRRGSIGVSLRHVLVLLSVLPKKKVQDIFIIGKLILLMIKQSKIPITKDSMSLQYIVCSILLDLATTALQ